MLSEEDREHVQGLINDSLQGLRDELKALTEKIPTPAHTPDKKEDSHEQEEQGGTPATPETQPEVEVPATKTQRYIRRGLRKVSRNG